MWGLAQAYANQGLLDRWEQELQQHYALDGAESAAKELRQAYARSGSRGALLKNIEIMSDPSHRITYYPIGVAANYVWLDDKDKAFAWLERAYKEHARLLFLRVDPNFDTVRSDSRFQNLLHRIGFPQ